jgi:hypothetical protein
MREQNTPKIYYPSALYQLSILKNKVWQCTSALHLFIMSHFKTRLCLEKEMTSCQYLFEVYALSRLTVMVFVYIQYPGVVLFSLVSERVV